jgi:ABC-type branched-subunit amino acid transport system ATPase component/ABC-type branched-subunit amino acid transport system permease subunit
VSAFAAVRRIEPARWARIALGLVGGTLVVAILLQLLPSLLPAAEYRGPWETPFPFVLLGIIVGLPYGLLGVGLVLIYRTNRIINFAHGEMGAFAAAFFSLAAVRWHIPYWVAFPMALAAAGLAGAAVETAVVRRLRKAPRLMSVVATLGAGQVLLAFSALFYAEARAGALFPDPPGLPTFNVGPLYVTQAYSAMLFLSPAVVIGLVLFLRRSRWGLAILGSAANPDAARMAGIFAARMSSLAWAIAGALSAFTAIMIQPTQGFAGEQFFGPSLLLRALACAAVARMSSMAVALLAGVGLGIIEQLVFFNYGSGTLMSVVLFVVILLALLVQRPRAGREEEKGSWAAVQALRPIPDAFRRLWIARNLGKVIGLIGLAIAALLPLFLSDAASITLTGIIAFTVVGVSVGLITGLGGQLTLGQFALAGIGAVASIHVARSSGNFFLAFLYAGVAGALASLVIGLPALRIKGLLLTVTTLSFALMVPVWLLDQSWMLGGTDEVPKVEIFGRSLVTGRSYYYFALLVFLIVMWLARNVWRGGFGRLLRAIRDNEDAARAFTIPATMSKTQAFLLSGFLAGIGGAVYTHALTAINAGSFLVTTSIAVVMMTVVGGISLLIGPLLGVLLVVGLPNLALTDSLAIFGTRLGILLLILYLPGGLGSLVEPIRDRLLRWFARRRGIAVATVGEGMVAEGLSEEAVAKRAAAPVIEPVLQTSRVVAGEVLLQARDLRKSFGGVHAVDGASIEVLGGQTVGVIGPNGAGKTTMFELLAGFTRLDHGMVWFDGRDITWMRPEERGHLGLIRSFQDAALFPTLTVVEVIQLALERVAPTRIVSSTLGFHGLERAKERRARQIISFMGLDPFWNKQVRELSTGTRRIVELASMVALEPTLLLLDEPSSGIAQKETEQLGRLLTDLKDQFGMTLLIIEHDIPLIMGMADRIIAMADGQVIAEGPPDVVREDPAVIESYLGGTLAAIERSGERTDQTYAAASTAPSEVSAP